MALEPFVPLDPQVFFSAHAAVVSLVDAPDVERHWDDESSCAGMTVGGLTRHLLLQSAHVITALTSPASPGPEADFIGILEHYRRATWVTGGARDEGSARVRERSNAQGATGYDEALTELDRITSALPGALVDPAEWVLVTWTGWWLPTSDFLLTRLMEVVVHSDDLAVSVGLPTPPFEPDVLDPVLRLLTSLSLARHGQDALVRTLARPQRAPADGISALA